MRVLFLSMVLALCGVIAPAAAQAVAQSYYLNIPRQPLDAALRDLAQQTGLQIARLDDSKSRMPLVGPLRGEMSVDSALKAILVPNRLSYRVVNERTIAIVPPGQSLASRTAIGPANLSSASAARDQQQEGKSASSSRFRLAQTSAATSTDDAAVGQGPDGSADQQAPGLQEIVVTAEKVKERLINVPISMSVLSASDLDRMGATQFTDFATAIPGLDFSTAGSGFTQISMRGVTTGYDVSSTVGIYLDDVPIGSSSTFALGNLFAFDPALFDMSSIEVLRGPQGTLYGASAMGGLIRYVTTPPELVNFAGNAQVGASEIAGGGTGYHVSSAVNLPLIPAKMAARLSAYENHDGGYIDNVALDRRNVDAGDTYGGRADVLWQPIQRLSVQLSGFLQDTSRGGEATADYNADGDMPYGSLGQYRPFPGGEPFTEHFRLVSGKLTYDFGSAVLTAISGYQVLTEANIWDVSSGFAPLCAVLEPFSCSSLAAQSNIGMHKFTQEVRLASRHNRTLDWLLGVFYAHETASQYEYFLLRGPADQSEPNNLFTYYLPSRYEEGAAFGDVTWHLFRRLDLTGGIRFARDSQTFTQGGSGLFGTSKPTTSSSEDVRNYLGTLRYHFTPNRTAYFRYSTGYRPGGPNYVTLNPVTGRPNGPATSQPDSLREYEVGTKVETNDRRLAADFSAYTIGWSDIQVATNSGGFSSITNAPGGATVNGAEFSVMTKPVSRLAASVALAYTHAYLNGSVAALGAAAGERLPGSPRFTASLNTDYQLSDSRVRPTVGGSFQYISDRTIDFSGSRPATVQPTLPSYTVVDLRAGLTVGVANAQLFIHNLFDERGEASIMLPQFGDRVAIVQPRTFGAEVLVTF